MRTQITISGSKKLKDSLDRLHRIGNEAVTEFVEELTLETHARAVRGISQGPASGRVYEKYKPRRTHKASGPGQYPMTDTGQLVASIRFELPRSNERPVGFVGTNLVYGRYLELKPSALGGRPWLSRAFREAVADADQMLKGIFERRNK